jgi:mannose-6-phosphate isomerase-like protein (cupin superfamily)
MAHTPLNIEKEFIVLDDNLDAHVEALDEGLFERLSNNYGDFNNCKLISCFHFEKDWPTWEIHPHGDEIVILLSGEVTFILQLEGGDQQITVSEPGSCVIVPKNTWHTAKTTTQTKMLFVTPGKDTQNKPV